MITKTELKDDIDRAWLDLNQYLSRLTEDKMTGKMDANGWTVKDHLIHLTAWERSMAYMLRGKPGHLAIGVEEELFRDGTYDEQNAEVYRKTHELDLNAVLAEFRYVHLDLLSELKPLTDADLDQPYSHYLPDEAGGDQKSTAKKILANTAEHYREHLSWMKAIVK